MGALARIGARARRPVDAGSLVALRVLFGLLMAFAGLRFWQRGWIEEHLVVPTRFFSHWGLDWVRPLPAPGMTVVVGATIAAAIAVAAGLRTRLAAATFTVLFTYVHLCDVTWYLNHHVLVTLLGLLLAVVPVGAAGTRVPAWFVWLFRFQIGVVYFFGGVGKLNADWLLRAEPLTTWLARSGDVPVLGLAAHTTWLAFAMSWAGAAFDLTVPFLLSARRTRAVAYAVACLFHLVTARLFQLGMFPWLMMAFGLVFFEPGWPSALARRLPHARSAQSGAAPAGSVASAPRWLAPAAVALVALELVVPLRGLLHPGNGLWTEQGFRFAWKVMLVEKNGDVAARVTDRQTGRTSIVDPRELYQPLQARMMATQPDLLLQMAHAIRDRERARGRDVEVRLDVFVAMNGRRSRRLVDPTVDLAREEDGWRPKHWLLPLDEPGSSLPVAQRSGP